MVSRPIAVAAIWNPAAPSLSRMFSTIPFVCVCPGGVRGGCGLGRKQTQPETEDRGTRGGGLRQREAQGESSGGITGLPYGVGDGVFWGWSWRCSKIGKPNFTLPNVT